MGAHIVPAPTWPQRNRRDRIPSHHVKPDPFGDLVLMIQWANDFRAVFWVAVIPGILSVLLLMVGVREPEPHVGAKGTNPIKWTNLVRLGS